jgi:hypothetical protein
MAKEAQVDAVVSVPDEETTTKKGKKGKKEKKEPEPQVKISELFQFATGFDVFVLSLAAVLAFVCGCLQIGMMMAFEVMMDGIGETAQAGDINTADFDWGWYLFIGLGGGLWLTTFLYAGTADYCKERMTARWKMAYLKAIVRQDVGWYDTNNPEELSTRIGESIKNIEEGMASKLFLGVEMVGMGIAGVVLTGWYRWDMAIIVIATSPIIMGAGALLTNVQTTSTKKIQDAYAEAGGIAGEQLSAVRTVAALGIEDIGAARYSAKLSTAEAVRAAPTARARTTDARAPPRSRISPPRPPSPFPLPGDDQGEGPARPRQLPSLLGAQPVHRRRDDLRRRPLHPRPLRHRRQGAVELLARQRVCGQHDQREHRRLHAFPARERRRVRAVVRQDHLVR